MTGRSLRSIGRMLGRLGKVSRAGEWWEHKLVPIFAVFYATALHLDVAIWTLWPAALMLLLGLVAGAVYVSVANDVADRADDAAAGKPNRMAGRPAWQAGLMIAAPVCLGLLVAFLWSDDVPLMVAYLAAWIAFTLYSVQPFRLKARGLAGVIADAGGAHLFPSLVAALLVFRQAGVESNPAWLAATALWAASYGLRGIFWHQLHDLDNDRVSGVRTFVERHGPDRVAALARYLVFPAEVAGLTVMLWLMGSPLPLLALLAYLMVAERRVAFWKMRAVLARPQPRYFILLADYYDAFLPLALLVASALSHPLDLLVVAVHVLLFPNRIRTVVEDMWRLRRGFLLLVARRQNR